MSGILDADGQDPKSWQILMDQPSRFRHRFGGEPSHTGILPRDQQIPLHLLCTLDLADPRITLPIRDIPELPLFYGFLYDATRMVYEVVSDAEICIVSQDTTSPEEDFPYSEYPRAFPDEPFDIGEFPETDLSQDGDMGNPFREEVFEGISSQRERRHLMNTMDPVERFAIATDLPQGPMPVSCIRSGCNSPTRIFCVIDPIIIGSVHLWDDSGEEEGVKIVYEICPKCALIRASNQAT